MNNADMLYKNCGKWLRCCQWCCGVPNVRIVVFSCSPSSAHGMFSSLEMFYGRWRKRTFHSLRYNRLQNYWPLSASISQSKGVWRVSKMKNYKALPRKCRKHDKFPYQLNRLPMQIAPKLISPTVQWHSVFLQSDELLYRNRHVFLTQITFTEKTTSWTV